MAGCLIGPAVFNWVAADSALELLSEIGAVLLLFSVGLETKIKDLTSIGRTATFVGVLGVVVPFLVGSGWAYFSGFSSAKAMFLAAAFVATSAGITARVLQELGVMGRVESKVILGAAVIDDILAMLLLGVVTAINAGGQVDIKSLLLVVGQALAFVIIVGWLGARVMKSSEDLLELPINPLSPLSLSLAACLGLAVLSAQIGLAAIIGAFLAGVVVAETRHQHQLEKQIQPIMVLIVPFFFVLTGMKVDLAALSNWHAICTVLVLTLLASLSKVIGGGLGAAALGFKSALIVGVGMVPRGEVGVIIASLGLAAGIFSPEMYAVVIAVSLLTSVVAPPLLKVLFR